MDNQNTRENFVIETFKRLGYGAHIHAEGSGPSDVVVSTPAGATASYPVVAVGDRYSLYPQAEADAAVIEQLKEDGLTLTQTHETNRAKDRGK